MGGEDGGRAGIINSKTLALTSEDLTKILVKANNSTASKILSGSSGKGVEKILNNLIEVERISPKNIKSVTAALRDREYAAFYGEAFRLRACEEVGWQNIKDLEMTILKNTGRADRYVDIVLKNDIRIETKYWASLLNKDVSKINEYLVQIEKDINEGKSFEHWLSKTGTVTSEAQLHQEIKTILTSPNYANANVKRLIGNLDIDVFIDKVFKFKDFNAY